MPKLKSPLFSLEARGSLGPQLAYQHAPSGPRAIRRAARRDPQTPAQLASRLAFRNAADFWHGLSDTEKAPFTTEAKGTPLNGYNLFMQQALKGEIILDPIGARVYNNAPISVPHATYFPLPFNSEAYDTADLHDPVAAPTRLTAPVAGLYVAILGISWATNAVGYRDLRIRQRGVTFIASARINPVAAAWTNMTLSAPSWLAAGDWLTVVARQTSGGPLNINYSPSLSPWFAMHRVR